MEFNGVLLNHYRELLQNTDLQKAYQEFIRLFRYLRRELKKELPDYTFQADVTENGMDYSYFQFSNKRLKEAGLKIAVVFVHKKFSLEV